MLKTKKRRHLEAMWVKEIAKSGLREAILDRIKFHAGMPLEDLVKLTGYSLQTIRKHCKKLQLENKVVLSFKFDKEWISNENIK